MSDDSMESFERARNKLINPAKSISQPSTQSNDVDIEMALTKMDKMVGILSDISKSAQTPAKVNREYWYDESSVITTANNTAITNPDSNLYTRIRVFEILERTSPRLTVYNDGPGTLYIRASHGKNSWSTTEFPVYEGEAKSYIDIYELRMRATLANLNYRVTEFELWKQKNVDFRAGRGIILTNSLVAGETAATPAAGYAVAHAHLFNPTLTRNASTGYIKNLDGLNDLWVWISQDGTNYGTNTAVEYTTIDANGAMNIDYLDVYSIKVASMNTIQYQILVA